MSYTDWQAATNTAQDKFRQTSKGKAGFFLEVFDVCVIILTKSIYFANFYATSPGSLPEVSYKIKHNKNKTLKVIN